MNTDEIKKEIEEDDDREEIRFLLQHFNIVATLVLLNDWLARQPNPEEKKENFLNDWAASNLKQFQKEMEGIRKNPGNEFLSRLAGFDFETLGIRRKEKLEKVKNILNAVLTLEK